MSFFNKGEFLNMTDFIPALAGGILIGLSVALLLLFYGRIAGISGMLSGLLQPQKTEAIWRLFFLAGIVAGAFIFQLIFPGFNVPRQSFPLYLLPVSGFLVGWGTSMANGCVSGHGVCGLARLSIRSAYAVLSFMLSGMITVYIVRHVLELTA